MESQRESLELLKLQELGDFLIRDSKYSVHAFSVHSYTYKNYVPTSGFILLIIILLYSVHRDFNIMCTFHIVFFLWDFMIITAIQAYQKHKNCLACKSTFPPYLL